ncbi:hypothetical protein CEE44_04780 [Candidatus Woesearchaeota archaeon B3_Woes]|nr:MAG: hypothetical protein CEE44_04780 [Candidatus Woesearchaeota archaeon B3_Woes]
MSSKKQKWTNTMAQVWKNYRPPIRPSKDDLRVFNEFLEKKIKQYGKEVKVLILGSTPEFRDLVNSKKLTVYVCDYNKKNNEALKLLKKVKGKDVLILQDWIKLKLNEKFDLVFAEASLNMVKGSDVPIILRNVKNILKDDGLFLAKTWVRVSKSLVPMDKIIRIYRTKYKGKSFKNYMNQYLLSNFYDRGNGSLNGQYLGMKRLYEKGQITKKEFSSVLGLDYETTPLVLYLPMKKELTKIVKKYMKLVRIITPKPVGTNKVPVYVMKK